MLVLAACLFWIGLLSLAFTAIGGFTVSSGWLLAGALVFSTVAWVLVMIREMAGAVELPDDHAAVSMVSPYFEEPKSGEDTNPRFHASSDRNSGRKLSIQETGSRRGRPRKARSSAATPPA